MSVKDVFGSIFVLITTNLFTYITGKLMLILQANTNSRSPRSIFLKNDFEQTHLCQQF